MITRNSFLFMLLIRCLIPSQCHSQDHTYFNYNIENILPSAEVYQIYQDKSGFIWFATDNGVVRFDGGDAITFNKFNGLADPVVFGINEDQRGNLYFRSFSGLVSMFSNDTMMPYPYNNRIKEIVGNSLMSSLIVDSRGMLYASTSSSTTGKIASIDTAGNVTTIFQHPLTLFVKQIGKQILIGYRGTLGSIENFVIDDRKFKIARHDTLENNAVLCHAFWKEQIYFSKDHYLYKYDGQSVKMIKRFNKPIISISCINDDYLWIGQMNGGVERFSETTFQFGFKMPSFEKLSVTTVLQDKEGGLWFSTLERGVFYIPNSKIINYIYPPHSKLNAVAATRDLIFMGFNSGKVSAVNVATRKEAWSLDVKDPVMSVFFDQPKNEIWLSTNSKTVVISKEGKLLREAEGTKSIKKFFRLPNNEIGAINAKGLYKVDKSGYLNIEKEFKFWLRNIVIAESKVYLAGITGVYKTDLTFAQIEPLKEFETIKVSDIQVLPDGSILIASIGSGIRVISANGKVLPKKKNAFLFENAYQVWIDTCVWIATEKGMFWTATENITKNSFAHYDFVNKGTGLISDQVNFIWRFENETWCFSSDGYSVIKNDEIHFANKRPTYYIKGIFLNHKMVQKTPNYDLPHNKNDIRISLGFISFNNRNIIIRHRTNHSDQVWNYSTATMLEYFALMPDSHTFDIEFSSDYTSWEKVNFPHTFVISPPWWESYYFKAILFFLIVFLVYYFFRVRYRAVLNTQRLVRIEKERIAMDLHDNLGSQLTSLSQTLGRLTKVEVQHCDKIKEAHDHANDILLELRETIWVINKSEVPLVEVFDKIINLVWRLRKQHETVKFKLNLPDTIAAHTLKPTVALNLFRIAQESINNSLKHGEPNVIAVNLGIERNKITLSVEDNGKGFDMTLVDESKHYGLANIKKRAREIKGHLEVQTEPERGTDISVTVLI